jgi:hypothetical protein
VTITSTAAQVQVGPRRDDDSRAGQRVAGVTQRHERREGQSATGGVAADDDLPGVRAAGDEPAVDGQRVLHGRRERMLGGQAVAGAEHPRLRRRRQPRDYASEPGGRAHVVGAAVEVQHHPLARHPGRGHPLRRDAICVDRINLRALGQRRAGRPHQRAALLERQGAQVSAAHELKHGLELLTGHPGILRPPALAESSQPATRPATE